MLRNYPEALRVLGELMRLSLFASMSFACFILIGCSIDTGTGSRYMPDEQNASVKRREAPDYYIEGRVIAAPTVYLEDERFFDVNQLEIATEKVLASRLFSAEGGSYEVEIYPAIDNQSFVDNFEIYIKGRASYSGATEWNGQFKLTGLPEGPYHIRAQKRFRAKITRQQDIQYVCFYMYSEKRNLSLGVTMQKSYLNLDRYYIEILDPQCEEI